MPNTHSKFDKKSNNVNVNHRKTTETLRLVGEADLTLGVGTSSTVTHHMQAASLRKKTQSQQTTSSFQVTEVLTIGNQSDFGDDSADDLDESHTEDISRDNETPSISEDSRDTDDQYMCKCTNVSQAGPAATTSQPPSTSFTIESEVLKKKQAGRWVCIDYRANLPDYQGHQRLTQGQPLQVASSVCENVPTSQVSNLPSPTLNCRSESTFLATLGVPNLAVYLCRFRRNYN